MVDKNVILCSTCGKDTSLRQCGSKIDGFLWRCPKGHAKSVRHNSFFPNPHINLRDLMLFIFEFLNGGTMWSIFQKTGLAYKSTCIDWCNLSMDICREYVYKKVISDDPLMFNGDIEIDEAKFGRKNQMGQEYGLNVWVLLIERTSNRVIMYPVNSRDAETLIPIIERHCAKGSRIFSDGWEAYMNLNRLGQQFTVIHSYQFRRVYVNDITGKTINCDINTIKGSWKCQKAFPKN